MYVLCNTIGTTIFIYFASNLDKWVTDWCILTINKLVFLQQGYPSEMENDSGHVGENPKMFV